MRIEKKAVRSGKLKLTKNVQITLGEDMNVPDSKPDVEKIVDSRGEIHIDEVEVTSDRIKIRGAFLVEVLYLSQEPGHSLASMQHEFAIDEWMNMEGALESDQAKIFVNIEDLTVSIINSRKCGIRSVLFFHINLLESKYVDCTVGIDEDAKMECLFQSVPMTEIIINKKDILRVKAEVSLPSGKPNIREILWNSVQMRDVEIRLLEGKLSIRGSIFLFLLYRGEEESEAISSYDWEIPFSNELECADSRENLIGNIAAALGSHQVVIKSDGDGEPRNVELEAVLELDIMAYQEYSMKLLKDLYANDRKLKLSGTEISFENLLFQNNAKKKIVQRVSAEETASRLMQVLNVEGNVRIEDYHITKEGILTEGLLFCKLLYIAGDDAVPMKGKEIIIPFEYLVEVQSISEMDRCEIHGVLEQIGGYVVDGNELEIRAEAGIYVTGFSPKTMEMIEKVEEVPYSDEELCAIPSITAYVVKTGDSLWLIAKQYGTTIGKIKEYNENVTEPLEAGQKLILLKELEPMEM